MRRNGFTLMELIVALTLSGVVVLFAHTIFSGVLSGTQQVADVRDELDRQMNARRWLLEAFGSLDISNASVGFTGRAHAMEFTAWQRAADGTLAIQRVSIWLSADTLFFAGSARIPLASTVGRVDFDYLLDPGAKAAWVREWISPVSAPLAVRVRMQRQAAVDTLLFLVGPRG